MGIKMEIQKLSKAPLKEAIFELRWKVKSDAVDSPIMDPHSKIFVGELYSCLKEEYPYHEQLPTVDIPDAIGENVVQHRFRKDKDIWPLIQVGPGIITLNDTSKYFWNDFAERISNLVKLVFEIHPASESLVFSGITLRYIDARDFDFEKSNILDFLSSQLKVNASIDENLLRDTPIDKYPLGIDLRFTYPLHQPRGVVHLRFARGLNDDNPSLIWETVVQSLGKDVPSKGEDILRWANDAHTLTHGWFFKMITGDLLEEFR
jgi:uncharacterized protein (TIGR04255 family)